MTWALRRQLEQQNLCGATGAIVGAAVIGAGASIYGANKQASASSAANAANASSVASANQQNWDEYLLSRGISSSTPIPTGEVPTSGYTAANTKLPLWANVNVPNNLASKAGSSGIGSSLVGGGGSGSGAGGYAPRGMSPASPGGSPNLPVYNNPAPTIPVQYPDGVSY